MGSVIVGVLVTAAMIGLIWLGYWGAEHDLAEERDELNSQRNKLDAQWTALEQTRRVNDVFFLARDAMRQAEADATDQERRRWP